MGALKAPAVEAQRTLPHAIEAEQNVLGALLLWPDAYDRIDWLLPGHFYRGDHRAIYAAIEGLLQAGRQCDVFLVCDALRASGELEQCGGQPYIGSLAPNTPSAANIVRYAEIVRDRYRLREIIAKGTEIAAAGFERFANPIEIAGQAEAAFLGLLDESRGQEMVSFARAVGDAMDARDAPQDTRIRTGYPRLDQMLKGGLLPGQLMVIAGRSSMGKSTLAWNIGEHVAAHRMVAGFTLEMSAQEIAERSLRHHEDELGTGAALSHLRNDITMQIDETPGASVAHVRLRCRRLQRKHGLGLVIVDYLQLMSARGENRTQEIGSISRGLKAFAKELRVPVIAVAQINRGPESRQDKRPMLSDMREGGDIENDADIAIVLYRDDYYDPGSEARGYAEVIVRKQRNGPTGMVPMIFDAARTRFIHYDGEIPRAPGPGPKVKNLADYKSKATGDE